MQLPDAPCRPVTWEAQRLDAITSSLCERPGSERVLFAHTSLLHDGLIACVRVPRVVVRTGGRRVRLRAWDGHPCARARPAHWPSCLQPPLDASRHEWFRRVQDEYLAVHARPCATGTTDVCVADVHAHLLAHAPTIVDLLDGPTTDRWAHALASTAEPTAGGWSRPTGAWEHRGSACVEADHDAQAVAAMLAAGAVWEDHELEVPSYRSWTRLQPGRRLYHRLDGAHVWYVPRGRVVDGVTSGRRWRVRYDLDGSHARAYADAHRPPVHALSALAVRERGSGGVVESRSLVTGVDANRLRRLRHYDVDDPRAFRRTRMATIDDLALPASAFDRPGSKAPIMVPVDDAWMDGSAYRRWRRCVAPAERIVTSAFEFEFDHAGSATPYGAEIDAAMGTACHEAGMRSAEATSHFLCWVRREHDVARVTGLGGFEHPSEVDQTAPRSERGRVRVHAPDLETLVEALGRIGLVEAMCERVPYDALYRSGRRSGRVLPLARAYVTDGSVLSLPRGHLPLHGLTSADRGSGALARVFDQVVRSGGLKSIAARREAQISVHSLSPLGDIASGIDHGVPTKIGACPSYGRHLYIAFVPWVLERRDLWFSDRDFGGGHDRNGQYEEYARAIGQDGIDAEASHEARQRHLRKGVLGHGHNECYLRDEVPLSEWDTVWVGEGVRVGEHPLSSLVRATLDEHGGEDVRVRTFSSDGDLREQISARADALTC